MWHGVVIVGVLVLGACSSSGSPEVLQELSTFLGDAPVHVTYDNASRVCSTVRNGTPVCQTIDLQQGTGIQQARLDQDKSGVYVLRLLLQSEATLDGMPSEVMRMSVGLDTDLVVALYDSAPACFHQTDPDGQTRIVTVEASQVDNGSGVTAAAAVTENAC
jgi:hypothetical protein